MKGQQKEQRSASTVNVKKTAQIAVGVSAEDVRRLVAKLKEEDAKK